MKTVRIRIGALVAALAIILCCFHSEFSALALDYPSRPIEMVIPFEPGSGTDVIGRLIADLAQEHLGTRIIINNKPGGAGASGYTYIKNSKPNGYVIGVANSALTSHKIFGNLSFDHNDVEVIILTHTSPSVLVVPAKSKYTTFQEILDDARMQPGKITWGTAAGNALACSRDIFNHAGVTFKVVPFGGGALQPVIQTSGGHVDMSLSNYLEARTQIEAGLLRPIAVYAKKRIETLPDIPTFEELGYPVRCPVVRGVIAPPGVDKEKLNILNDAFKKAVASQKYQEFVQNSAGVALSESFEDAMKILNEQQKANQEVASFK